MPPRFVLDPLRVGDDASRLLMGVAGYDDVGYVGDDDVGYVGDVGDDEVGADILDPFNVGDDEVGAMSMADVRRMVANPRNLLARVEQERQRRQVQLRRGRQQHQAQKIATVAHTRDMPTTYLSVDSVAVIAAGATVAINATPVSPCRPTNFTVMGAISNLFIINSILNGRLNLFMSAGAIPADRFNPEAVRPPMESPIVPASVPIVVSVTNISGAPVRFIASFDVIDLSTQIN